MRKIILYMTNDKGGIKMSEKSVKITVYGTEQICTSCICALNPVQNYESLQAAIGRKYNHPNIFYEYIDIEAEHEDEKHQSFIQRIFEEDLFYPIVFVNDDLVAEGIPTLKPIYDKIEKAIS